MRLSFLQRTRTRSNYFPLFWLIGIVFTCICTLCVLKSYSQFHFHQATLLSIDFGQVLPGHTLRIFQESKKLIEHVRESGYIEAPSIAPYNLQEPSIDPSMGQSKIVLKVLNNMRNGYFVECGALDGETRSNTLQLETKYGWTGLLVEADPANYKMVKTKHRNAWTSNVCLATKDFPHQVMFAPKFNTGKISDALTVDWKEEAITPPANQVRVQCIPLFTLLSALNISTVDYFSLDVEGNELDVLQTIPWHKLLIRVLSVEYIHNNVPQSVIEEYMKGKGYRVEAKVHHPNNLANDFIFVHKSVQTS